MSNSSNLFLTDPNLDEFNDLVDNSEYGTYFNIKHYLFNLGADVNV